MTGGNMLVGHDDDNDYDEDDDGNDDNDDEDDQGSSGGGRQDPGRSSSNQWPQRDFKGFLRHHFLHHHGDHHHLLLRNFRHRGHHWHPQVALKQPASSKSGNVFDLFKSVGLLRSTLIM